MNARQGPSIKPKSRLTPLVSTIATATVQIEQHLRILRTLQMQYDTMRYLAEFIVSFDSPGIRNSRRIKTVDLKALAIQAEDELGLKCHH